jgi:ADP-ribose pyrophosphatase YjhB (NUDIX family)
MTPTQQLALWADKLRDVSAMGLRFATNPYDKQNYATLQTMAMAMMALVAGETLEQIEPLRGPVFERPTPITVADGAVVDDSGRILLIRRADNGLWAMPGGALEVGETAAAGVEREALEETGVPSRAVAFVGVFDSRLCGTLTRHHLYHLTYLCRPTGEPAIAPSHPQEVLEIAWFDEDELPAEMDPGHASRLPEAFRVWRGDPRPFFDP